MNIIKEAGALFSYGSNAPSSFASIGRYVDQLSKDTRPAELPVEQTDRIRLAVNSKPAKALGIKIPEAIVVRADEVIK